MLRGAFEDAEPALIAHELSGRILYANAAFGRLVGLPSETLRGCDPPYPFWHPRHAAQARAQLELVLSGQGERLGLRSIEARFRRSDGRTIDVVLAGGALRLRGELAGYGGFAIERTDGNQDALGAGVAAVFSAVEALQGTLLAAGGAPATLAASPPRLEPLGATPREQQVLGLLLEGLRVPSIARRMQVSPHTVRNHLKSLFRKARVGSQAELIERYRPPTHAPRRPRGVAERTRGRPESEVGA